ncbi:MAG: hypothetical protein Q7J68_01885, partial [Thermoplasmata archaeon]|nr:hypothetical protein [Thermoplasmata archaeon]
EGLNEIIMPGEFMHYIQSQDAALSLFPSTAQWLYNYTRDNVVLVTFTLTGTESYDFLDALMGYGYKAYGMREICELSLPQEFYDHLFTIGLRFTHHSPGVWEIVCGFGSAVGEAIIGGVELIIEGVEVVVETIEDWAAYVAEYGWAIIADWMTFMENLATLLIEFGYHLWEGDLIEWLVQDVFPGFKERLIETLYFLIAPNILDLANVDSNQYIPEGEGIDFTDDLTLDDYSAFQDYTGIYDVNSLELIPQFMMINMGMSDGKFFIEAGIIDPGDIYDVIYSFFSDIVGVDIDSILLGSILQFATISLTDPIDTVTSIYENILDFLVVQGVNYCGVDAEANKLFIDPETNENMFPQIIEGAVEDIKNFTLPVNISLPGTTPENFSEEIITLSPTILLPFPMGFIITFGCGPVDIFTVSFSIVFGKLTDGRLFFDIYLQISMGVDINWWTLGLEEGVEAAAGLNWNLCFPYGHRDHSGGFFYIALIDFDKTFERVYDLSISHLGGGVEYWVPVVLINE